MRIPKRTALGVSGLVFAGATALGLSAATPASASGCCGVGHSRHHSSARVHNRNFNFSRSLSEQAQHEHQRHSRFDHENRFDFFRDNENNKKQDDKHDSKW